ncbi:MAG: LysR substrate-binding domain-containing protein, partial [Xanthomonadales bacterium]|nr:LysR substrate-binding domain-containing protein [Xanthomonadales bacterium]
RAFCAAARHSTLKHAADELFLTPSAVSHQIKNLETELGVALFARTGRTLELTEAGEIFYKEASSALVQLETAAANLQASQSRVSLLVSVQPFLASELLIPRLQEFSKNNPKIEVNIDASDESVDPDSIAVDVSIRLHKRPPADLQSHLLFPLTLVPACAPELLEEAKGVTTGMQTSVPFVVQGNRLGAWRQWANQCGIKLSESTSVVRFDSMSAIVQAAERGVGIALVPIGLTDDSFSEGRLVRFFNHTLETGEAYYIAFRKDNPKLREIRFFTGWVLETLGQSDLQHR